MNPRQELISRNVDTHKDMILEAERWLWAHPQTGYTEWEAHEYLKEHFEALGYELTETDGFFGARTEDAVLLWQLKYGFDSDGEMNEE